MCIEPNRERPGVIPYVIPCAFRGLFVGRLLRAQITTTRGHTHPTVSRVFYTFEELDVPLRAHLVLKLEQRRARLDVHNLPEAKLA